MIQLEKQKLNLKDFTCTKATRLPKVLIKFQQLATCPVGDAALCHQAHNGLAKHIKDDVELHLSVGCREFKISTRSVPTAD